jgi:glycosyltransferase involved in cell wall biosynthesis
MINVCYTVDAPFVGGAERYVSRIATGLDPERFRPTVVMWEPPCPGAGLGRWRRSLEDAGVPVTAVPMDIPKKPLRIPGVLRAIAAAEPHVVHVNMPGPQDGQMGTLVPLARMAGAAGVVVTEHLPMVGSTWKRRLIKRVSYRWVDRVTTVCHANVRYLLDDQFVPGHKAAVIHNALDGAYGRRDGRPAADMRNRYGLPDDRTVVVFVGNLIRHKGLHRIIKALSDMPDLPWHLLVVGDGPERGRSEQRLRSLGFLERTTFAGARTPEEVEQILPAADLLSLPSTTEGMPYVILEAMASSLPVVATAVYGIPEMVVDGETGLLVQPDDGAALAGALRALIGNPGERERMGRAARARFERLFTLDRQLESIETLYLELAGLKPARR